MKLLAIKINLLLLSLFILTEVGCEDLLSKNRYNYQAPEMQADGLETATAEKSGIDSRYLVDMVKAIKKGKYNEIHSVLIYRKNKLVFEEYFKGHQYQWDAKKYHGELVQWDRTMKHPIMSCTKSITSACIGIAIDKGYINNTDQSVFDYLPDHQQLNTDNKKYITIGHLLTMTSGLAWDEWNSAHGGQLTNDYDHLYVVDDQVKTVLERPWQAPPGEFFTYNGGGIVILGEIMKNATGMNMDEFARENLFEPLGIHSVSWWSYPNGRLETASSLSLTPRAMLKFGILYLNNGNWKGQQIISPGWIEKSTAVYRNNVGIKLPIEDSGLNGYGYTWWMSELPGNDKNIQIYRANGWGGQVIMVFPALDMVVVFTSGNWAQKSKLFHLVQKFILPSISN